MKIQDRNLIAAMRAMYRYGCQLEHREFNEEEFSASLVDPEIIDVTAALRAALEAAFDDALESGQVLNG